MALNRRSEPTDGFDPERLAADEPSLSQVFDRAWAAAVLREAGLLQAEQTKPKGKEAPSLTVVLIVNNGGSFW